MKTTSSAHTYTSGNTVTTVEITYSSPNSNITISLVLEASTDHPNSRLFHACGYLWNHNDIIDSRQAGITYRGKELTGPQVMSWVARMAKLHDLS